MQYLINTKTIQIEAIEYKHINIPLKFQFAQANNVTAQSDAIILCIQNTDGLKGYGETCPRQYVTGESADSVFNDLKVIGNYLKQLSFNSLEDIQYLATKDLPGKIGLSTICAIELALLDLWTKMNDQNIVEALGGQHQKIQYSGIVPLVKIKYLELVLQQLKYFQFKQVKLKVGTALKDSLEKIQLIRSVLGNDVSIRLDANTAWTYDEARQFIPAYLAEGINSFEQIFPKEQVQKLGKITAEFGQDAFIMADESLTSFEDAHYLIQRGLCNAFNLKISKNGGLFNTLRIYKLARGFNISCQLGAHFAETSILTRAGAWLSTLAPEVLANEGGFGTYLLEKDIVASTIQIDEHGQIDTRLIPQCMEMKPE